MSQSPPTAMQSKVLTTARAMYLAADGVPPTQQAVADRLGLSKPTVHGHAQELRREAAGACGHVRASPVAGSRDAHDDGAERGGRVAAGRGMGTPAQGGKHEATHNDSWRILRTPA
jgi:hypothetical protein